MKPTASLKVVGAFFLSQAALLAIARLLAPETESIHQRWWSIGGQALIGSGLLVGYVDARKAARFWAVMLALLSVVAMGLGGSVGGLLQLSLSTICLYLLFGKPGPKIVALSAAFLLLLLGTSAVGMYAKATGWNLLGSLQGGDAHQASPLAPGELDRGFYKLKIESNHWSLKDPATYPKGEDIDLWLVHPAYNASVMVVHMSFTEKLMSGSLPMVAEAILDSTRELYKTWLGEGFGTAELANGRPVSWARGRGKDSSVEDYTVHTYWVVESDDRYIYLVLAGTAEATGALEAEFKRMVESLVLKGESPIAGTSSP